MPRLLQRLWDSVTPGVRVLLGLPGGACAIGIVGTLTHSFDLTGWLGLSASAFRRGELWRLLTYALVPSGIAGLIANWFALAVLGGLVERNSSRGQLWLACACSAIGGGLAHVLLNFSGSSTLTGATPLVFGLLVAWGCRCGRDPVPVFLLGETTVWRLVLVTAGISWLITACSAGRRPAMVLLAGGLGGGLYAWAGHRRLMSRDSQAAHSERIHHLEL